MWMPPSNRLLLPHHWDERLVAAWSPGIQGAGGLVLRDQHGVNNGTLTNGPVWQDQALSFTTDDYVDTTESMNLSKSVTLAAWVKPTAVNATYEIVLARDTDASNRGYILSKGAFSGAVWNFINATGGSTVSSATSDLTTSWTHVVGTHDGVTLRLFINGRQVAGAANTNATTGSSTFQIGRRAFSTFEQYFEGGVDDIRIYSAALSPQEIAELWNGGERNAAYGIRRRRTVAPRAVTAAGLLPITQAYMRTRC